MEQKQHINGYSHFSLNACSYMQGCQGNKHYGVDIYIE